MSEPIPESIPTSADPRSRRPLKRARLPGSHGTNANAAALAAQADEIENLMWDPTRPVHLPDPSSSDGKSSSLAPPPEIVANVQGSSAGAGSGEFHVYKASRRRENERLRAMDEEARREIENEKFEVERSERAKKDEERTRKNREKRNKRKNNRGDGGGKVDAKVEDTKKKGVGLTRRREESEDSSSAPAVPSAANGSDFAVAEVVKENGITIHDDD